MSRTARERLGESEKMMRRPGGVPRVRVLGGALLLFAAFSNPAMPGQPAAPDTLRVVFTPDVFATVNRNDALASARAWIEAVGHKRGLDLFVEVDTYASAADLRKIVLDRSADLFILNTMHYLDLTTEQDLLDPMFLPQAGEFVLDAYVLLARRDSEPQLSDLRGKRLLFLRSTGTSLGRLWFDSRIRESDLGTLDDFCPSALDVAKPSAAVLPVFFGQADACVVDESSFRIMQELNPQLGKVLETITRSPPYLETVLCVHHDYSKNREDLLEGLASLHEEAKGRQLLMVFKIDHLVPFYDEVLNSVHELRASNQQKTGIAAR